MHAKLRWIALSALIVMSLEPAQVWAQVTGAGSSAAKALYSSWADAYQKATGITVSYDASGSSAGIKKVTERAVDFGASDVPMSGADKASNDLLCLPTAVTGVVPVVNLPIKAGGVTLDGAVLADIYAGKITRWSDPAITALNGGHALPDMAIKPIGRSDGSGTTYNFATYLSRNSSDWNKRYGTNFTISWHIDVLGAKGSDEVLAALQKTQGAIAYLDYAHVVDKRLIYTRLKNRSGQNVEPNFNTFSGALTNSSWKTRVNFEELLIDLPGSDSWPITAGTYIVLPHATTNPDKTVAALKFFSWSFLHGDTMAKQAGYVRLNDSLQAIVFASMSSITDKSGKRIAWSPF